MAQTDTVATCGRLILGGFSGTTLTPTYARALASGERGGAILFKRNLFADPLEITSLTSKICEVSVEPTLIAIDQEGGRVARLREPLLRLPPMARLANRARLHDDVDFVERVARAQGAELAALGFSTGLAPVLDVNSRADNPIIGDRAFGETAEIAARYALRFAAGLRKGGVFACGKHFPGHGDTSKDSHVDLPVIEHDRERLRRVEIHPFRAAASAGIEALMTAHVVFSSLDPDVPATLSHAICTDLLRGELRFEGVLFSDDLEMRAIAARYTIEESAVEAVRAGCDVLLVCESEEQQTRAFEALVRRAETEPVFYERCREAAARVIALCRRFTPRPVMDREALQKVIDGPESRAIARELSERGLS